MPPLSNSARYWCDVDKLGGGYDGGCGFGMNGREALKGKRRRGMLMIASVLLSVLIIIIIIIIIIAFKGAIRDFLQSPHSAANCLQHVRSSGPGATVCKSRAAHQALIMCKCHVTCHLVRRSSSAIKFDRVEIAFI